MKPGRRVSSVEHSPDRSSPSGLGDDRSQPVGTERTTEFDELDTFV